MTHAIFELLSELDAARLYYTLSRTRPEAILVSIALVGERVEVDVFDDGHMEVSRFRGSEEIVGARDLIRQIIAGNRD